MSIKTGTVLPDFELNDQYGNTFSSTSVKGKQAVVIYFYPKNFTSECTKEACSFRDSFEDFIAQNIVVIGISSDTEESHKKFASKFNLPFILLADSKKKVRKLFGVKNDLLGLVAGRETFVFDANGILITKFKSMNAAPHIEGALHQLNELPK
ncbi:peroxiredoxin [Patiriisocius marinistellae]|uniref:thioredoxin-dependent peroxiredoxin n=1 Tax=Patiriisocius marinistellae TaxID=2494560 RepID=A0A5J4G3E5_9FLAO|nr:peroxiredoxin [Patiriisocius marinistellae]GEQ86871.1 peroxiredoxin [Patiriisocius marinistellae]